MSLIAFMLNLPWTILGLLAAFVSVPRRARISRKPFMVLVHVQSLWWKTYLLRQPGVRATTSGNIVLLSQNILPKDIEHELIHVTQYRQRPLIFPCLYALESHRHGHRNNKYEVEAYDRAKNKYKSG